MAPRGPPLRLPRETVAVWPRAHAQREVGSSVGGRLPRERRQRGRQPIAQRAAAFSVAPRRFLRGEREADGGEHGAKLGVDMRQPIGVGALDARDERLRSAWRDQGRGGGARLGGHIGMLVGALHEVGLATLVHTPGPPRALSALLGRPDDERLVALLPVGRPAAGCTVPATTRRPLSKVLVER